MVLLGGAVPGKPPGSLRPRFSAREGFAPPPIRKLGTVGADWKFVMFGLAFGGRRKFDGTPPGPLTIGPPDGGGPGLPAMPGDIIGERPCAPLGGGAPCRPRCTAWILANMSCETLSPLPRLVMVEAFGRGFRAALIFPSGVEDGVMLAVVAPDVEMERMAGRGGSSALGWGSRVTEGAEGDSRGPPEARPFSSGVDAMVVVRDAALCSRWSARVGGAEKR